MKKILIAYYSFSGTTQTVAEEIARVTAGSLLEIKPADAYSFDYNTAAKKARAEIARGFCPKLMPDYVHVEEYDVIFIGSPNWFKSFAPPVLSFLRGHDFAGKTIVPFCTHGGGGFGEIEHRIAQECPDAKLLSGLAITGSANASEEITLWLSKIGLPV